MPAGRYSGLNPPENIPEKVPNVLRFLEVFRLVFVFPVLYCLREAISQRHDL